MTPEERSEKLVADWCDGGATLRRSHAAAIADAIREAVAQERERAARIAEREGIPLYTSASEEIARQVIARAIRRGEETEK